MKTLIADGQGYRVPDILNPFQQELYIHLINWKWANITHEPGMDRGVVYDAIIPKEQFEEQLPLLYPAIVPAFQAHHKKYLFRIHKYFFHMASSQAANVNLFLPILLHSAASTILSQLKPDFARLAIDQLDHGFRIEYWDEPFNNLGDKTGTTGTDADMAMAYYNHQDQLCLWLIEHKLTEKEFTTCGGFRSSSRQPRHDCNKSFSDILDNPATCFYHDVNHYNYWQVTRANRDFFANHVQHMHCPFHDGLNQLWRNQLLCLSIEADDRQPYESVTFSVVKHPRNVYLDKSLAEYRQLIADNPKFTVFTSADVIEAATTVQDPELEKWIAWYKCLYAL